jgi:hypothetical protein
MSGSDAVQGVPPLIKADDLKPYASLMILESTSQDHESMMDALCDQMQRASLKVRSPNQAVVVASGIADIDAYLATSLVSGRVDQAWGFVYRKTLLPAWAALHSGYSNVEHEIGVVLRRNSLIAVHCNGSLRTSMQNWLDRFPRPSLRRVDPAILQGAFLKGDAKGLWLRGAQAPTTARPDSKTAAGRRLQDTLNSFEDGGFALASARASIETSLSLEEFTGTVGTTPRHSIVWSRPTASFPEFIKLVMEIFEVIEETIASGGAVERPYPVLAEESTDLSAVSGAFDLVIATADDLPVGSDVDPDVLNAVSYLERATLLVDGLASSADFVLSVGYNGSMAGKLRCAVIQDGKEFRFSLGFDPASIQTDPPTVRSILDALQLCTNLFNIYYDSGHVLDGKSIWRRQVLPAPFPNWRRSLVTAVQMIYIGASPRMVTRLFSHG